MVYFYHVHAIELGILFVSLNIKNPQVERLIDEVARLTGETKTEAVRQALADRRDKLAQGSPGPSRAALAPLSRARSLAGYSTSNARPPNVEIGGGADPRLWR